MREEGDMMKAMNNAITHADLVNAGIIILEQEKEDAFLDAANDIFADLVGTEVIRQIRKSKSGDAQILWEDIRKFFKTNPEKCRMIVSTVRNRVMKILKNSRKQALTGAHIEIPTEGRESGTITSERKTPPEGGSERNNKQEHTTRR